MLQYKYIYNLFPDVVNSLKAYDISDWIKVTGDILYERSIDLNISFSEDNPITCLIELYKLTESEKIDNRLYQAALVGLLEEYYGRTTKNIEIYRIIHVIDYIKPIQYYKRLESIVVNPQHDHMVHEVGPDAISLHLRLINTIMRFDHEFNLYPYLKGLLKLNPAITYYQLVIRYVYVSNTQNLFDTCLNSLFPLFSDAQKLHFGLSALKEYIFYKKQCGLVFYWLLNHHRYLQKHDHFIQFVNEIFKIVDAEGNRESISMYYHTYTILNSFRKKNLKPENFEILISSDFASKRDFFSFLGEFNNSIIPSRSSDGTWHILFKDGTLHQYDRTYNNELNSLEDGQRRMKTEEYKDEELVIPESIVQQSKLP